MPLASDFRRLARRGEVDLRRVMVSGLLCLGANHGVGRLHGLCDFASVEPMKWTSRASVEPESR